MGPPIAHSVLVDVSQAESSNSLVLVLTPWFSILKIFMDAQDIFGSAIRATVESTVFHFAEYALSHHLCRKSEAPFLFSPCHFMRLWCHCSCLYIAVFLLTVIRMPSLLVSEIFLVLSAIHIILFVVL